MSVFEFVRKNLAQLTLLAVVLGAVVSLVFRGQVLLSSPLSASELMQEVQAGANMPVLIFSRSIDRVYAQNAALFLKPLDLETAPNEKTLILIPDKYSLFNVSCSSGHVLLPGVDLVPTTTWFRGSLEAHPEVDSRQGRKTSAFVFRGSLFACNRDGAQSIGSSINLIIDVADTNAKTQTPSNIEVKRCRGLIAYPAFFADLYIAFLLMVFVPTLALSVVKSVVDSSLGLGTQALLTTCLKYLTITGLLAVAIGVVTGYVSHMRGSNLDLDQLASLSLGGKLAEPEYDPHPLLTQLGNMIPTNPFSALSNPDGNKGLQVSFLAIVAGLLLALVDQDSRTKVSGFLRRALALVVKDADLGWKALSDWADFLTPFGVFFVTLEFAATMPANEMHDVGWLIAAILGGLITYVTVLTGWLVLRRNWRCWIRDGLVPGVSGLLTALASSSSYAALPQITAVPLLSNHTVRRGIFDLNTTLNKCGTTLYISAVSSFILFNKGFSTSSLLIVFLFSMLASIATAGLPFAAVFGLRMLLLAMGLPGSLAWVILPIDPLVDRFVTVVNVYSNLAACSDKRPELRFDLRIPALALQTDDPSQISMGK